MPQFHLSIAADFELEAESHANAQQQALAIREELTSRFYGPERSVGQFRFLRLVSARDYAADYQNRPTAPPPDLRTLKLPPGWQDEPSYRAGSEYRLLLRLPQGQDPAIEVRLDNRRKKTGRKGLRIKARNTPAKQLARCGAALSEARDHMDYFNALLKADPDPAPDPRPIDSWLNDFLEYCLLQKVTVDDLKYTNPNRPPPDNSKLRQQLAQRSKALRQRLGNRPLPNQSQPATPAETP